MQTETAKAAALPAPFAWRGHTYQVAAIDLNAEIRFAALLKARAEQGLSAGRAALGAESYQDALQQHRDDLACGEYEWGGRVYQKALRTDGGLRELAFLCLNAGGQEFPRELLHALYRDRAPDLDEGGKPVPLSSAWDRMVLTLYDLMAPPPNGQRPAQEAAGRSSEPPTSSPS